MKRILCPECGSEMDLYGIFESGEVKFHCSSCYRVLDKIESFKLGVKISDSNWNKEKGWYS